MARPAKRHTRRQFLKTSAALTAGAASTLSFAAPAIGQRPKLNYWCYQFLKASDDARAIFAREWAQKNRPEELKYLMPEGKIIPSLERARRWRAILSEWRAATGLPPIA